MAGGRPPIFETAEEMANAIDLYFFPPKKQKRGAITAEEEPEFEPRQKVTICGLALHLGFESRQSFYDYEEKPEFSYIIRKARLRVEMSYEERLSENACTGSIFALKNMGWKDKTEVDNNTNLTVNWPEEHTF